MKRRVFAVAAVIGTMVLAACAPTPPTVTPPPVVPPTGDSPTGLDPSFGSDGYMNASMSTTGADRILAVAAGASNSVFGAGFVSDAGDTSFAVAKYTSNGVLDASFGTGGVSTVNVSPGTGTVEQARSITIQADGKIVIAGSVPTLAPGDDPRELDIAAVRLNADGSPDAGFGTGGIAIVDGGPGYVPLLAGTQGIAAYNTDSAWGSGVLSDGRVVIWGSAVKPGATIQPDTDFVILGLTAAGQLDTSFGTNGFTRVDFGGSFDNPRNLIVQPDDKIVTVGYETRVASLIPLTTQTNPVLARFNPDGSLDPTFGSGGVATTSVLGFVGEAYQVGVQSDGSYAVAGYGRPGATGLVDMILFRFNADGTFDSTFAGGAGITRIDLAGEADRARNVIVLPDDRILAVGAGSPAAGASDALVVLASPDGFLETSFNLQGYVNRDLGGPADALFGAALAGDNKTVWVGGFRGEASGGNDEAYLGRINLDF